MIDPIQEFSNYYSKKLGYIDNSLIKYIPDFLIIAPPRTGTTWLSENLGIHPGIFITSREIRYFSRYWKFFDINWYLRQFEKGMGKKKGEKSPEYSTLPLQVIKFIRSINPNLRLIFIMRDPIEMAWSHTKHNFMMHEANFISYNGDFDNIPDSKFIENFTHEWPIACSDYLGSLKRWLEVFPKEQIYINFYESIKNDPKKLLDEIFDFLGVEKEVDWATFRISERIFEGIKRELPENFKPYLRDIYNERTRHLAKFLKEQFNIDIPNEWQNTFYYSNGDMQECRNSDIFQRLDELHLIDLLNMENDYMTVGPAVIEKTTRKSRENLKGHRSCIIWFTGLPASGKSTIANELDYILNTKGIHSYVLDADDIRLGLNKDLCYTKEDRSENIRRVGEVAKLFMDAGIVTITAFISPFREDRTMVRNLVKEDEFIEIYTKCPISVCQERDPKGLYKIAINGEIENFTGINHPYEEPLNPEILLETDRLSISESINKIITYIIPIIKISDKEYSHNIHNKICPG